MSEEEIPIEYYLTKNGEVVKFVRYDELDKYKIVLDKIKEYIKESIECSKGVLSNPEHAIVGKHELIKLEIENYKRILELLEEIE